MNRMMLRQTQSHRESTSETLQCCVSARFSNKQTDKVWDGLGLWTWHKENTAYESRGRDLDPARLTSGIFTREWNWFVLLTFSSFLRVHRLRLDNTGATLQLESTRWCSPLYKNLLRTCRMSIVRSSFGKSQMVQSHFNCKNEEEVTESFGRLSVMSQ